VAAPRGRYGIDQEAELILWMHLLNAKLREWKPETAAEVRERGTEIIGLADQDLLDL
jgi:hypothetical protein